MENPLPKEIILEIISRLPAESVLDCRRVSKTWRSLTYHPSFARLQLRRSLLLDDDDDDQNHYDNAVASSPKVGIIWFSIICLTDDDIECQLYYGEFDDQENKSYKKLSKINHPSFFDPYFVGSCNGLICVSVNHHHPKIQGSVYICNPITRESVELPRINVIYMGGSYTAFGFGYIPKANVYKVVRIYYHCSENVGHVEVYTLGSGLGWRNKGEINYKCAQPGIGVIGNGAIYWRAFGDGKIVSFGLADEEFGLLPSPPCFQYRYELKWLGGLLCAVHAEEDGSWNIWSLNLMDEQKHQSWGWSFVYKIKKMDCITDILCESDRLALAKHGEVLSCYYKSVLFRSNLKTAVQEKLVEYVSGWGVYKDTPHMNSFISLKALGEDAKTIGSAEGVIELEDFYTEDEGEMEII